ncbi:LADA_0H12024g1_1 [Lachancea dasiensis]|uniref:LADA_0H12024g1_1 n=1 Tax=Lachancea dasiensis TaxID=1072105 RepID=A0A1G4K3L7_9SACH|nr:LADA_0H12024g1_1 [Lachancea dasiensis]
MPLTWTQRGSGLNGKSSLSSNEDRLSSDASLKAAQAIFKKHGTALGPENKSLNKNKARITVGTKPQPAKPALRVKSVPRRPRAPSKVKSPTLKTPVSNIGTLTAAQAAAAKAQRSVLKVEPQVKPKPSRLSKIFGASSNEPKFNPHSAPSPGPNSLAPPAQKSASPHRSPSFSGSVDSQASVRSGQTDDIDEIVAKLQASKDNLLPYKFSRAPRSGSTSPKANISTDSILSANTSSEDVWGQLRSRGAQDGPPLLSKRTVNNSSAISDPQIGEMGNSFSSKPEFPGTLAIMPSSTHTITIKRPFSRSQGKENMGGDNFSISSMQSSVYSGFPSTGMGGEALSDQDVSEFSISPRAENYRPELARSSLDYGSGFFETNPDRLSTDALGKNFKQPGTLPDLIPNHKWEKKQGRLSSFFGKKAKSVASQNSSSNNLGLEKDQNVISGKNSQQTRLMTTMRRESEDIKDTISEESSDEYESESSGGAFGSTNKKHKTKGRRARLGHQIKKASGHHHSHRKSFNEDKPWKSHIDIGFVTQAERKRYEGMWVTNRNCYLDLLPWWDDNCQSEDKNMVSDEGLMLNLVVLDIWSRSHLPQNKLAAIYDMVDTRGDGTLERKSFIVGMWLVDQSLYGRKLPSRIQPRVWESVDRYVINVPNEERSGLNHKDKKKQVKQTMKQLKKGMKKSQR